MTITCPCPSCDFSPNCKCGPERYERIRRWNERAFPGDRAPEPPPADRGAER